MGIRILIVDDHHMVRFGLRIFLAAQPDLDVVGEAEDGLTAVAKTISLKPDVVILDVMLPDINGIEVTSRITPKRETKAIGYSGFPDPQLPVDMLKAGAVGFVLKTTTNDVLPHAIRAVMNGSVYLCDQTAAMLGRASVAGTLLQERPAFDALSTREREILLCVSDGLTVQRTADRLRLSLSAVKTYRQRMAEKLRTSNSVQLTKIAIAQGLVRLIT